MKTRELKMSEFERSTDDETRKNNIDFINSFVDNLRKDLLELIENDDNLAFELSPIYMKHPYSQVLTGRSIKISSDWNVLYEINEYHEPK